MRARCWGGAAGKRESSTACFFAPELLRNTRVCSFTLVAFCLLSNFPNLCMHAFLATLIAEELEKEHHVQAHQSSHDLGALSSLPLSPCICSCPCRAGGTPCKQPRSCLPTCTPASTATSPSPSSLGAWGFFHARQCSQSPSSAS